MERWWEEFGLEWMHSKRNKRNEGRHQVGIKVSGVTVHKTGTIVVKTGVSYAQSDTHLGLLLLELGMTQ